MNPSSANLDELLLNGNKRLAFLRMQTGGTRVSSSTSTSATTYLARYAPGVGGAPGGAPGAPSQKLELVVDGKPQPQLAPLLTNKGGETKARYSNWGPGNMDPDHVRRHERSLQRAGFKSNDHAKGGQF